MQEKQEKQKKQFFSVLTLIVIVVVLTGFDYLLITFQVDLNEITAPLLLILFPLALVILVLTFKIWQIILTEESKVKIQHKRLLLVAAILTIATGLSGLFIYSIEIILASGFLEPPYYELDLTTNQNETGLVFLLMVLMYLLKLIHNISAFTGCVLTSFVWTWQFRIWARFSEAPFIRSFYFVGVAMIILFLDQLITITLVFVSYGINLESSAIYQILLLILLLIATIVMPFYIYFLAKAGQHLRIPYEKEEKSKSRMVIILPMIFFVLWFCTYLYLLLMRPEDSLFLFVASLITSGLFFAIFIPISIRFFRCARRVDSAYLKKNLLLAAVGTLALSTAGIVGPEQWAGMTTLSGYLLAFSILTWSFSNISQFLGSREALSRRLDDAGAQFLTELGGAEMKAQSLQKMTKVMTDVTKIFMKDLDKMPVRTPPTKKEIHRYIVSTVGMKTSLSEAEVQEYLKKAVSFIEEIPGEQ